MAAEDRQSSFLDLGCEVTSVETSSEWVDFLKQAVGSHLKWHLVEHRHDDPAKDHATYPRYVHTGAPWDVVIIDNTEAEHLSRVACVTEAHAVHTTRWDACF